MHEENIPKIGFTCAYAPLAVIEAAGFAPYRILPMGDTQEQAGALLHDNLCPHVKHILDKALSDDLPGMAGMLFINSCDAMRRLADAWRWAKPGIPAILLDLPISSDERAVIFFADEIRRFATALKAWGGRDVGPGELIAAMDRYNRLSDLINQLNLRQRQGQLSGGRARLQEVYNTASTRLSAHGCMQAQAILEQSGEQLEPGAGAPVLVFGNIIPDPGFFELIESCGGRVVGDDLCTGSRMFSFVQCDENQDPYGQLAAALLRKAPCARTIAAEKPGQCASDIIALAHTTGAKGIIGHTLKFCDPYIARMPMIREMFKQAGIPFLLLEGDCSLGSLGQQQTRIEAFMEMLR